MKGFNFQFRHPDSVSDIHKVIDFLAKQPLGYPKYNEWVQRTEAELPNKTLWLVLLIAGLVFGFGGIVALVYFLGPRKNLKN